MPLVAGFFVRGRMVVMEPILEAWKHFIHDLDPPSRIAGTPPGILIALACMIVGVLAALLCWFLGRK
jgi:hypothetical protein